MYHKQSLSTPPKNLSGDNYSVCAQCSFSVFLHSQHLLRLLISYVFIQYLIQINIKAKFEPGHYQHDFCAKKKLFILKSQHGWVVKMKT